MSGQLTIDDYLYAIFPARPSSRSVDGYEEQQWYQIHFLFGEATLWAQAYEDGIARFVITAEAQVKNTGKTEEELWRLTLGALQKEYCRYSVVEASHLRRMAIALETRNALAHNFYRRRRELLGSADGRQKIIQELQDAITLFQSERDEMYWNLSLINGQIPL